MEDSNKSSAGVETFSLLSYNMHGFRQGITELQSLIDNLALDIIFVQEHWQVSATLEVFSRHFPGYLFFGTSACFSIGNNLIPHGRPSGGLGVLVNCNYAGVTKFLSSTDRVLIILVGQFMFINIYLPCHGTPDRIVIIDDILNDIYTVCEQFNDYHVIMAGDFNHQLSLDDNLSDKFRGFFANMGLLCCDEKFDCVSGYTYFNHKLSNYSFIDYVCCDKSIVMNSFDVLDTATNLSDHCPVIANFEGELSVSSQNVKQCYDVLRSKPRLYRWDHGDKESYYQQTGIKLQQIRDTLMADEKCLFENFGYSVPAAIDFYISQLVTVLIDSSHSFIPRHCSTFYKFWWNEHLSECKNNSVASHKIWCAAGKPRSGFIFNNYLSARREYRSAIRRRQKESELVYTNELHDCLVVKDNASFWKSWKSKFENKKLPSHISGTTDPAEICETFKNHFRTVSELTTPERSQIPMYNIDFLSRLSAYKGFSLFSDEYFDSNNIHNVIHNSPKGRAPGLDNVTVEHLLYAHPCVSSLLSKLFTMMFNNSYVPESFKVSYTVPLPKSKDIYSKTLTPCDFRGIAISSHIGKIFERCLLLVFDDYARTSDNQMGFKKQLGCRNAIYCLQNVTDMLCRTVGNANICSLDISRAFDNVNHVTLLNKLMDLHLPEKLIILLANWLPCCRTCVRWDSYLSDMFYIQRGVRQGSVLAPFLFILYIDSILNIVDSCLRIFILMYADDIVIITARISDLEHVVHRIESELEYLSLSLNTSKSYCIRVGKRHSAEVLPVLTLDGSPIPWVDKIIYLGIQFSSGLNLRVDLHKSKLAFFRSFNSIMAKIGATASEEVLLHLLVTKCLPSLMYCLEVLNLSNSVVRSLDYCIIRSLMKIFRCNDITVIRDCIFYFQFDLPSDLVHKRRQRFLAPINSDMNCLHFI